MSIFEYVAKYGIFAYFRGSVRKCEFFWFYVGAICYFEVGVMARWDMVYDVKVATKLW